MFDIFDLSRQIPQCAAIVRIELSMFNQASNKNTWHTHVTPAFENGVGGRNPDTTEVT